ncbi:MAG: cytochrome c oxidase subunit II [Sandaracinaceae bacterium]
MNEEAYDATIQMPEGASTLAHSVDSLYYDIYWISVAFFVAIVGAMVWFAYRFRRRPGVKSKPPGHHNALELFWTFSPLLLLAYMFHQGFSGFMTMAIAPENAINMHVRGYQWRWEFEYPNGMVDSELRVPVHRPVRMIMSSVPRGPNPEDGAVLHSFFIPAFRVKRDVVPGMYTSLWFEATREGTFDIFCTEYCGTGHSAMLNHVIVMPQADYDQFMGGGPACPDEIENDWEWGQQVFAENGCNACHYVDAAQGVLVGPNLANVAGTEQPLEGGSTVLADLEYIRNSIRSPQQDIVRSFTSAAMPPFNLPQRKFDALVSYIAHLSSSGDSLEIPLHCGAAAEQE